MKCDLFHSRSHRKFYFLSSAGFCTNIFLGLYCVLARTSVADMSLNPVAVSIML